VLTGLCALPLASRHSYAIARDAGLKSCTLCPVLIWLDNRGLMEACCEDEEPADRHVRHPYQLTSAGPASATAALVRPPRRWRGRHVLACRRAGGSVHRAGDGRVDRAVAALADPVREPGLVKRGWRFDYSTSSCSGSAPRTGARTPGRS
jgi:hypothetical protein